MKNHSYSDYLDNEQFLKAVKKYMSKFADFDSIKDAIGDEVNTLIFSSHGDSNEVNTYLAKAKSLIEVLQYINNLSTRSEDNLVDYTFDESL